MNEKNKTSPHVRVLFLCTQNSTCSQMAEGLLRHFYSDRYEAYSAGVTSTTVHPLTFSVMDEIGIDISKQTSKGIEEYRGLDFDVVVTVCDNTHDLDYLFCSTYGTTGERPKLIVETLRNVEFFTKHDFFDPSEVKGSYEEQLNAFRSVRDDIKKWIIEYFYYPSG